MTDEYLVTPRVRLRQFRATDAAYLQELGSDPDVMRHLTGKPETPEYVQAAAERILSLQSRFDGQLGFYMAELLDDGPFIGWFHLRPDKQDPDNTRVLELGYRLKRVFWGQNYATEVSAELVAKAFTELAAESVFAQTARDNLASRRVMEKIGMRLEREFIHPDRTTASPYWVIYWLNCADWQLGDPRCYTR